MQQTLETLLGMVFDVLDRELDRYVIMNNYAELPYRLPSDIDICICQDDFRRLDAIVQKVSKAADLLITQKIWHNYRKCAYILTPLCVTEPFRLQLDFFSDFSVKATPLLITDHEMLSKTRRVGRFIVPDDEMEFIFLLLRRIYKGDFDTAHCMVLYEILLKDEDAVVSYASKYLPLPLIKTVAELIKRQETAELMNLRPRLWHEVRKLSIKNAKIAYFLKYWSNQILRGLYRLRFPVGLSVAFLSPDGGGKSTVIKQIMATCWGSFHGIEIRYFRPRLLANLGRFNPLHPHMEPAANPDPLGRKADGPVKSLIRLLYYNLDFLLGAIQTYKMKVQKKLIVFDRYYFDYYVDMKRYGYSLPHFVPRLFGWMIPRPDITIILDGDARTLLARKQELSMEEMERQTKAYRELGKKLKGAVIINANEPAQTVAAAATEAILLYKAAATAKMMRLRVDQKGLPPHIRRESADPEPLDAGGGK